MTKLEQLRRKCEFTQYKLSTIANIPQTRISQYEKQISNLDNAHIDTICKFAKALGVKAWEVLNDESLSEMLRNVSRSEELEHDPWFDGSRIKEMRKRSKMTQFELSHDMCIAQGIVSHWERNGADTIRLGSLCFLCIYLDCHPCDLIDNKTLREKLRGVL
jgi:transcriptional regulator with XRE-family HTH domain